MDIASLAIVGAVVSLVIQGIKNLAKTNEYTTLGLVVIVSLIGGAVYHYIKPTPFWTDFYQIVVTAGAVYTYLIQRFETKTTI